METLPNDVDVEISSRVAPDSVASYRNLRLVSKAFRDACDHPNVLRRLNLQDMPRHGWVRNIHAHKAMLKRCRRWGNPEALFRKGLWNYFIDSKQPKGLRLLKEASNKGFKEAVYLYGIILVCLGNDTKNKGFGVLSTLMKPSMKATMDEVVVLRKNVRDDLWWRGQPVMKALKNAYVREECSCNGATLGYLDGHSWNNHYSEEHDIKTSAACEHCVWDHETKRLFRNLQ